MIPLVISWARNPIDPTAHAVVVLQHFFAKNALSGKSGLPSHPFRTITLMESLLLMEVKVPSPPLVSNPWKLPISDSLK